MGQLERMENELKSLQYHLEVFEKRYKESGKEEDKRQLEKTKRYIKALKDEMIKWM